MYSIKIMSEQNMGDDDVAKGFTMVLVDAGDHFTFGNRDDGEPIVTVQTHRDQDPSVMEYPLTGNAYVMSHTGKTVATYWARNNKPYHTTKLDIGVGKIHPSSDDIAAQARDSLKKAIDPARRDTVTLTTSDMVIDSVNSVVTELGQSADIRAILEQVEHCEQPKAQPEREKLFRSYVGRLTKAGMDHNQAMKHCNHLLFGTDYKEVGGVEKDSDQATYFNILHDLTNIQTMTLQRIRKQHVPVSVTERDSFFRNSVASLVKVGVPETRAWLLCGSVLKESQYLS